jgi:predicted GIY-YIG superfamily endonuclease
VGEGEGGVRNLDFYAEIMGALAQPYYFSMALFSDMYNLKAWIIQGINPEETYRLLCHCAVRIAKFTRSRLPDALHNRMVVGEQNHYTKEYARLLKGWDTRKKSEAVEVAT